MKISIHIFQKQSYGTVCRIAKRVKREIPDIEIEIILLKQRKHSILFTRSFNTISNRFFLFVTKKLLSLRINIACFFYYIKSLQKCNQDSLSKAFEFQLKKYDINFLFGYSSQNFSPSFQYTIPFVHIDFNLLFPGLSEIVQKKDFIGINFRNIHNKQVFLEYRIPTLATYKRNSSSIRFRVSEFIISCIQDFSKISYEKKLISECKESKSTIDISQIKLTMQKYLNLYRYLKYLILTFFYKYFSSERRKKRWGIAYFSQGWNHFDAKLIRKIPNPFHSYFADPFIIQFGSRNAILCEEFNYGEKIGSISSIDLSTTPPKIHHKVISESSHLSFPFPFFYEGEQYVVPESGDSKEIRIYRLAEFPHKWKLASVWKSQYNLYDPIIYFHDSLWWLMATIGNSKIGDYYSEMALFWSHNPIAGNWIKHDLFPLFVDSTRGRNAGFFHSDSRLLRVAQRYGFRNYGSSFSVYDVVQLSKTHYSEVKLMDSNSFFKNYSIQSHHLHSLNSILVFDFKTE